MNAREACALCRVDLRPEELGRCQGRPGRRACPACSGIPFQIDSWILERPLGDGGLGVVWAVRHAETGLSAALKLLRPEKDSDEKSLKRFRREAQAMASLDHPHILGVQSAGNWENKRYLVMDLAEGGSMGNLLERGPLPVRWAARALAGIARGLEYAHGQSIVHRDVKPANILFDNTWRALLADFGLVRFAGSEGSSGLTAPGAGLGTLAYMPPEQIENALFADAKSDVWSLGVSVYEAVTRRLPFAAGTPLGFFTKIRDGRFEAPSSLAFGVSSAVDGLVEQMIRHDPKLRATAAQAAESLERLATGEGAGALPVLPAGLEEALVERALAQGYLTRETVRSLRDAARGGGAPFLERLREEAGLLPAQLADLDRVYVGSLGAGEGNVARLDTRTRLD